MYDPLAQYLRPPLQLLRLVDGSYQDQPADADGSLLSRALGTSLRRIDGRLRLFDTDSGAELFNPAEGFAGERRLRVDAGAQAADLQREIAELRERLAVADRD